MSISLGAILGLSAAQGAAGIANTAVNYVGQKALQEDSQSFSAQEAALARDWQSREAASARSWSTEEAQAARDFALSYDNTKYQRAAADMRAAGYNPAMLNGTLGTNSPVSTGAVSVGSSTGAAATSHSAAFHSGLGSILSSSINNAVTDLLKNKKTREALLATTGKKIHESVSQVSKVHNFADDSLDLSDDQFDKIKNNPKLYEKYLNLLTSKLGGYKG